MNKSSYRPDIDGLRAIAVLAVVMFHAGIPFISGGFIGVDVFFVISGYLITSIIVKEIRQGDFSLINFYERRIRRILPAFFVVVLFSTMIAYAWFLPPEFEAYGKSIVAAALSVSNILFWNESGYFDSSADLKPLLHTWSLGVEEQFYIFFPLFLLLISRFFGRSWLIWLLPVVMLSFLASIWGTHNQPEATFYLAHMRAWELALGGLLALGALPEIRQHYLREIMALSGIVMIVGGMVGLNSESSFPGLNALFPCVGAALLIHAGSSGHSRIGQLLSWRPLVLVGLMSYSLYLWHWPLLVFAKYYLIRPITNWEVASVILLSMAVAFLSWRFIERPFRKRKKVFSRRFVFSAGISATMLAVLAGSLIIQSKGVSQRIPEDVMKLVNGAGDVSKNINQCMVKNRRLNKGRSLCRIGSKTGEPSFVVLGDSHAGALMPGIDLVAKKYGKTGLHAAALSCPPLVGVKNQKGRKGKQCMKFRSGVLKMIEQTPALHTVLLIARWPAYAEGSRYGNDDPGPKPVLVDLVNHTSGNRAVFAQGLKRTVVRLRREKKEVYIIFSVPEVGWNVPRVLARNLWTGREMDIRPKWESFYERNKFVLSTVKKLAEKYGVTIIYPHKVLCDREYCSVSIDGKSLYRDDDHLNVFGAKYISSVFVPIFSK